MLNQLQNFLINLGKKRIIFFFVTIIIILSLSLFFQKNKMEQEMKLKIQFIEQKNMLRDELDDIIDEHEDLLDEYGALTDQLHAKDSVIQKQITEIRNLIRTKNDLKEAREKIEKLKSIAKKYIANIDSLLVLNAQLTIQKDSVINVNKDINWRNYKLNKKNEELAEAVNKGSVLSLNKLTVEPIKYKSTGKEALTKHAKKTQKIRICFSVAANPIAKAEIKTVYIQLIDNNGTLLTGGNSIKTNVLKEEVICTDSININYQNIEIKDCLEWERVNILEAGYYLTNLILEGEIAAQTTFRLK